MQDYQATTQGALNNPSSGTKPTSPTSSFSILYITSVRVLVLVCFGIKRENRNLVGLLDSGMQWPNLPINAVVSAAAVHGVRRSGAVAYELRRGALPCLLRFRSHHHHQCLQKNNKAGPGVLYSPILQSRLYSQKKFDFRENPEVPFLERIGLRRKQYKQGEQEQKAAAMSNIYIDDTPAEVKNAKGIHLLTMSTPNGQAVQIYLEELKDAYGVEWTTTLVDIMTNDQKKEWFLRLDPNGEFHQRRL